MYQICRHIMPNGFRCHSPALRGMPFYYFHARLHRLACAPSCRCYCFCREAGSLYCFKLAIYIVCSYFFFLGSIAFTLSIALVFAAGAVALGLPVVSEAGCGLASLPVGAVFFAPTGNGVVPFTTLAAESVGTDSLSFLTRIEMRRFDGSVGLFFTRSIWSA